MNGIITPEKCNAKKLRGYQTTIPQITILQSNPKSINPNNIKQLSYNYTFMSPPHNVHW